MRGFRAFILFKIYLMYVPEFCGIFVNDSKVNVRLTVYKVLVSKELKPIVSRTGWGKQEDGGSSQSSVKAVSC